MQPGTRVRTKELPCFTDEERAWLEYTTGTVVKRLEGCFSTMVEVQMDRNLFPPLFIENEVISFRLSEIEEI